MRQVFDGALSPTPNHYKIIGRAAEIARTLGRPVGGAEHLFLGMLHDGGWPVTVISGLADLGQAEAAVVEILNGPDYSPPARPRILAPTDYVQPWGAEVAFEMGDSYIGLEHVLLSMIRKRDTVPARALARLADALPDGTTYGFNSDEDHRTWIFVSTADAVGAPALAREILNTALATLNRL
jgi:hypothetical protein